MAFKSNLTIDQGSSFEIDLILSDENGTLVNLNGYTASSQIRKIYDSINVGAEFTTSINTAASKITLSLSPTQTSNLTSGKHVYDVELNKESNGEVIRVLEGLVFVTPQATK